VWVLHGRSTDKITFFPPSGALFFFGVVVFLDSCFLLDKVGDYNWHLQKGHLSVFLLQVNIHLMHI
jgi:hypothetical protein